MIKYCLEKLGVSHFKTKLQCKNYTSNPKCQTSCFEIYIGLLCFVITLLKVNKKVQSADGYFEQILSIGF